MKTRIKTIKKAEIIKDFCKIGKEKFRDLGDESIVSIGDTGKYLIAIFPEVVKHVRLKIDGYEEQVEFELAIFADAYDAMLYNQSCTRVLEDLYETKELTDIDQIPSAVITQIVNALYAQALPLDPFKI